MAQKKAKIIAAFALLLLFMGACQMSVNDPMRPFMEPYISVQPQSASYIIGDTSGAGYTSPPTLTVEVWDWAHSDGALSYQWYTFDDLDGYWAGGGTAIAGASGPVTFNDENTAVIEYTPDTLKSSPGDRNYFYLKITNVNDDALGDKKEGDILSETAVISFNSPATALIPVITRHPASNAYRFGESLRALEVRAFIPHDQGGVLSYQWYSNDKKSVAGGAAIDEATQAGFMPNPRTLTLGENYFYVIVTNTSTNYGSVSETAVPATITMTPGVRAADPVIETQPKDTLAFTGEAIKALTVAATSPDGGADSLSYQWYSNSIASVEGGEPQPVSGATGASFTPAGAGYYFVAVTNTNENVEGDKTATVNSRPVKVTVAAPGTQGENAVVTINPGERFNYIRGYGGMDTAWANFPETTAADTEFMYNPDTGLGYNILRIMIIPKSTNIEASMKWLVSGNPELDEGGGFREYFYENVKIANKHGGYVLASPWSPPKEWKSNNSINGGGELLPQYRKQYAQYLRTFARHMYDMGAPIYAVSIQNEPNYVAGYDGCEWTGEQMREFFKEVGHFTEGVKGWGGGVEIPRVLTVNGESANNPDINYPALNDPISNQYIDLLARHVYGSQRENLWNHPNRNGKEVWMTEHNINSASATAYPNDFTWNYVWRFMNDVDLVMRLNNENAFVWWASKRFYSMQSDGQNRAPGGTNGNDGDPTRPAPALPRGWGLSHYAKYTIGKTRIGVTVTGATGDGEAISNANVNNNNTPFSMDNVSAKITAYISEDNSEISMVMWTPTEVTGTKGVNMGTMRIELPSGFTAGGVSAVKSYSADGKSENTYMEPMEVSLSSDRDAAYVTMNESEIISIRFTKE